MKKAFSLVELVFVMVILGILASFIIPSFSAKKQDADIATIKIQIAAIRAGIRDYTTSQIISGKTKQILEVKDIPKKWDENKNDTIYPLFLEDFGDHKELFSTVLPNPIKGTSNNTKNGWSKQNSSNKLTYEGRYFIRFGKEAIRFDYCSIATQTESSKQICPPTNDTDKYKYMGKFYCSDSDKKNAVCWVKNKFNKYKIYKKERLAL
ncbi:type II secretion system protein [Campylobacter fetus]|nr:type II secretion system protein [Campylobacter fetus]